MIGGLLVASIAVAGVRATRQEPRALPTESPTAAVTMTFTGLPPYSPTPSETPSETVAPGTVSPAPTSPEETALPRTGGATGGAFPLVALTLVVAVGGGALLARAETRP